MQLFSKEKGTMWGITNGLLLASGVGLIIAILAILIFGFSTSGFLTCLGAIGIDILILLLINTKLNLLDRTYPFSRKFFNMVNLLGCFGWLIAVWAYIINLGNTKFDIGAFLMLLAPVLTYIITIAVANAKPIMISSNSKALNAVNFFSLAFCSNIIMAILMMLISTIMSGSHTNDIIGRIILFLVLILVGLVILIYCLNFRKHKNTQSVQKPQVFNVEKKASVEHASPAQSEDKDTKKQSESK